MMRLAVVALALAAALPACAQRAVGRGSFAGHISPAAHAPPAFRSFAPAPAYRPSSGPIFRSPYAPRAIQPVARYAPAAHPSFYTRRRFYSNRGAGVRPYPVVIAPGYWPAFNTGYFLDSFENYDAFDPDDPNNVAPQTTPQPDATYSEPAPQPYPAYATEPYATPYPAQPPYPPAPPYSPAAQYAPEPQPAPSQLAVQSAPASADTVTLIFNNGQPPEQIQNFLATRTTLTVIDGSHHRDIPIADLDVPATIKANHDAGIDFQLPSAR